MIDQHLAKASKEIKEKHESFLIIKGSYIDYYFLLQNAITIYDFLDKSLFDENQKEICIKAKKELLKKPSDVNKDKLIFFSQFLVDLLSLHIN